MEQVLVYIGSGIIIVWGIGHLAASKPVIAEFSSVSVDSHRIITMEWIAEGLTLCFVGVVALLATVAVRPSAAVILWACTGMLVVMAILSLLTGARTSIGPMRACPYVKLSVATLYAVANVLR